MKWTQKGHQYDDLGKNFKDKNIYIYGAGNIGKYCFEQLYFLDCVDAFVDRSLEKQKRTFCDKPVLTPDVLFKEHMKDHIIIIAMDSCEWVGEVERRLLLSGYIKNVDFFFYKDFIPNPYNDDYKDTFYIRIYSVYAKNKIYLDSTAVFPSSACNLKCKYCLAFTPHIKQHRIKTLVECKREVDVFFQWVDHVRWFQISGGEPLLWKDLNSLIEYIGKKYRSKIGHRFELVTNGTMVPNDELLQLLSKYEMDVVVDDYGTNYGNMRNECSAIKEKLEECNIPYHYNRVSNWVDLGFFECDNTGKDLVEYYDQCGIPFNTNEYGKIYSCAYCDFAIKAGLIEENTDDYFDLNKRLTNQAKKEFVEFTLGYSNRGYSTLCEHCYGWIETINKNFVGVAEQE